jgi:ribosomal protein L11 methyltransferase
MVSVLIPCPPDQQDALIADLYEAKTLGIVEGAGVLEAFFKDAESASRFGEPRECDDVDWVQQVRDSFQPLLIGQKFYVAAPWHTDPTPEGRIRLDINPGAQFGTGQHATTRLCLEAMESVVKPGDRVLDVGSGSAILSKAAWLLGAGKVVACDVDPEAAEAEALEDTPFFVGSVDAVRSGTFDVVVANISEEVIGEMKPDFDRVAPRRILSGFQDPTGQWTRLVE